MVRLAVNNAAGQEVAELVHGARPVGSYALAWDGRDQAGDIVPPGLYLVTLSVDGDARQTRRARTVGVAY